MALLTRPDCDPPARPIIKLLAIGTIPAVIVGLALESALDEVFESPFGVVPALIGTGVVLPASGWMVRRLRALEVSTIADALVVGRAQAVALIPGVSRSGMTITSSRGRPFSEVEAVRFSSLLTIPVILGGGAKQLLDLAGEAGLEWGLAIGVVVAAASGYSAIAGLIRVLTSWDLQPFAFDCVVVGATAVVAL